MSKSKQTDREMRRLTCNVAAALLLASTVAAFAAEQTHIYDSRGRSVGTATTDSQGSTRLRDERGRSVGTSSTTSNGTTNFFDARGNRVGSSAPR